MRCSLQHYTNSSLLTLTDKILSYPFIKVCMESYVQDYPEFEEDMFLNPVLMEQKVNIY